MADLKVVHDTVWMKLNHGEKSYNDQKVTKQIFQTFKNYCTYRYIWWGSHAKWACLGFILTWVRFLYTMRTLCLRESMITISQFVVYGSVCWKILKMIWLLIYISALIFLILLEKTLKSNVLGRRHITA